MRRSLGSMNTAARFGSRTFTLLSFRSFTLSRCANKPNGAIAAIGRKNLHHRIRRAAAAAAALASALAAPAGALQPGFTPPLASCFAAQRAQAPFSGLV